MEKRNVLYVHSALLFIHEVIFRRMDGTGDLHVTGKQPNVPSLPSYVVEINLPICLSACVQGESRGTVWKWEGRRAGKRETRKENGE